MDNGHISLLERYWVEVNHRTVTPVKVPANSLLKDLNESQDLWSFGLWWLWRSTGGKRIKLVLAWRVNCAHGPSSITQSVNTLVAHSNQLFEILVLGIKWHPHWFYVKTCHATFFVVVQVPALLSFWSSYQRSRPLLFPFFDWEN